MLDKSLKKLDLIFQLSCLIMSGIGGLVTKDIFVTLGIFYFGLGSAQLVSFLVHLTITKDARKKIKLRKIYGVTLIVVAALGILSLPVNGIIFYLFGVLFFTPVMAIYYLVITILELQELKNEK